MAKTLTPTQAISTLKAGGVVAIPTETVYGLAADAFQPNAVGRIFEIKGRPLDHPLIVHISDQAMLGRVAASVPEAAKALMQRFWPGPLTLVLPKAQTLPDLVTGGLSTVGVRMPSHPMALALIDAVQSPLAAPSANRFGSLSPTTAEHVADDLGDMLDGIVDGGACSVGVESTIIGFFDHKAVLLRPGGIALEDIASVIGDVARPEAGAKSVAPGMLPQHYAPRTPLCFIPEAGSAAAFVKEGECVGLLCFSNPPEQVTAHAVEILSAKGDAREAAANLYAALHRLDDAKVQRILAFAAPTKGLGIAINDRLKKAEGKGRD